MTTEVVMKYEKEFPHLRGLPHFAKIQLLAGEADFL
jgi:hypothetical protein